MKCFRSQNRFAAWYSAQRSKDTWILPSHSTTSAPAFTHSRSAAAAALGTFPGSSHTSANRSTLARMSCVESGSLQSMSACCRAAAVGCCGATDCASRNPASGIRYPVSGIRRCSPLPRLVLAPTLVGASTDLGWCSPLPRLVLSSTCAGRVLGASLKCVVGHSFHLLCKHS